MIFGWLGAWFGMTLFTQHWQTVRFTGDEGLNIWAILLVSCIAIDFSATNLR